MVIPIVIIIILLASCMKPAYTYYPFEYNVMNNTDGRIKVIFNGLLNGQYYEYRIFNDSVTSIEPGEQKILFISTREEHDLMNPENQDTLTAVLRLKIYLNDTVLSKTDFKKTRYWSYHVLNSMKAELNLTVESSDFK